MTGGVHFVLALFEYLDFLEKDELESPLPVDDIERLERRIQQENLTEDSLLSRVNKRPSRG